MNKLFEKVGGFVREHKEQLIKVAGSVAGSIVGLIVVGIAVAKTNEQLQAQTDFAFTSEPDRPAEEAIN